MGSKDKRLHELEAAATAMVQGSLSESTRQCGDRYKSDSKVHSVYVPAELGESVRQAQSAWAEFQQIGAEISAENRKQLLNSLERDKQRARAKRRGKS